MYTFARELLVTTTLSTSPDSISWLQNSTKVISLELPPLDAVILESRAMAPAPPMSSANVRVLSPLGNIPLKPSPPFLPSPPPPPPLPLPLPPELLPGVAGPPLPSAPLGPEPLKDFGFGLPAASDFPVAVGFLNFPNPRGTLQKTANAAEVQLFRTGTILTCTAARLIPGELRLSPLLKSPFLETLCKGSRDAASVKDLG